MDQNPYESPGEEIVRAELAPLKRPVGRKPNVMQFIGIMLAFVAAWAMFFMAAKVYRDLYPLPSRPTATSP